MKALISVSAGLRVASIGVIFLAAQAVAADPGCPAIADDAARLACYDRAAGRAAPMPAVIAPALIAPATEPPDQTAPTPTSRLSATWELDPSDKRGTFNLLPHKLNYLLPVNVTSSTNTLPSSPAAGHGVSTARSLDKIEAKFQLSLKIKALENVFGNNGDLWLAYTQQSYWQIYDSKQSSPFRTTDYEPEAFFSLRTGVNLFGLRWRMLNLGLVHQSNGNGLPLSRSWNRAYAQFGFERGDWSLLVRPWWRLPESGGDDDNPDIRKYMGSWDARLSYAQGGHLWSALGRYAGSGRGFLQLDWAWPISNALKGYVQFTSGYGASLIDYNHSQSTIGVGIVVFPWR